MKNLGVILEKLVLVGRLATVASHEPRVASLELRDASESSKLETSSSKLKLE